MYKVFTNDKPVLIQEKAPAKLSCKGTMILHYDYPSELNFALEFTQVEAVKKIILWNNNIQDLWLNFQHHFTPIAAAGGLVVNEKNKLLLIYRRGKWDLPKGKVDPGETVREAAIREVTEECGITDLKIVSELEQTYHTYSLESKNFLKTTHWFQMRSTSKNLIPQTEEDIEKVIWADREEALSCMKNTYPNIELLIKAYFSI